MFRASGRCLRCESAEFPGCSRLGLAHNNARRTVMRDDRGKAKKSRWRIPSLWRVGDRGRAAGEDSHDKKLSTSQFCSRVMKVFVADAAHPSASSGATKFVSWSLQKNDDVQAQRLAPASCIRSERRNWNGLRLIHGR